MSPRSLCVGLLLDLPDLPDAALPTLLASSLPTLLAQTWPGQLRLHVAAGDAAEAARQAVVDRTAEAARDPDRLEVTWVAGDAATARAAICAQAGADLLAWAHPADLWRPDTLTRLLAAHRAAGAGPALALTPIRFVDGPPAGVLLASDLTPQALQSDAPIYVQPSKYLLGLMSNEIAMRDVHDSEHGVIWQGERYLMDLQDELWDLHPHGGNGGNPCANHVGVSILALIEHGDKVILTHQSGLNAQNARRIAPSGSGSADFRDLKNCATFDEFLRRSMVRELWAECPLPGSWRHQVSRVRLTGFARLLDRGGKPEFFGAIQLPDLEVEVQGRFKERPFVGHL